MHIAAMMKLFPPTQKQWIAALTKTGEQSDYGVHVTAHTECHNMQEIHVIGMV